MQLEQPPSDCQSSPRVLSCKMLKVTSVCPCQLPRTALPEMSRSCRGLANFALALHGGIRAGHVVISSFAITHSSNKLSLHVHEVPEAQFYMSGDTRSATREQMHGLSSGVWITEQLNTQHPLASSKGCQHGSGFDEWPPSLLLLGSSNAEVPHRST